MERTIVQKNAQRVRLLRGLRKIHGWLGLWGAVLGLLFGVSGFLLNHRAVMKIPAARMEATEIQLGMAQPYPQDQKAFVRYIQQALDISQAPARPKGRPPQKETMAQTSEPARHGKVEDQATTQTSAAGMGSSGASAREGASVVKTAGKAEHDTRFMGQAMKQPAVWTVEFQLPQASIKAEYI
ncbi:MAG TPA: peptidase, partial [Methylophilaceae bacterium]|nr:peptidase [Methylophilaceae bacterium]